MNVFSEVDSYSTQLREAEHGGVGPIVFQRLMDGTQFLSSLDFIDFTTIPPGSTIGRHFHHGNEEIYFVVSGEPLINVNGTERRSRPGTVAIVRSGEWHELKNDTPSDVTILVVQASVANSV